MVIPAFNEESYLPALLDTVDRARQRYVRGSNAIEIIVAREALDVLMLNRIPCFKLTVRTEV